MTAQDPCYFTQHFDIFKVFETRKEHFNKFHHCFPLLIPEFRNVPFRWVKRVATFLVEKLEKY
jgi:hypothetical protein